MTDEPRKIISADNMYKILEVIRATEKSGGFLKGGAFIRITQDAIRLREMCNELIHYHDVGDVVMQEQIIGDLSKVL